MSQPELPPELWCEIFATATRDYCDNFEYTRVLNLSLVARRVHFWTERIFLEAITLWDGPHAEKFLRFVDMKPKGFFASVVRALCIPHSVTGANAIRIVSACPGVQMLACWVNYRSAPDLPLLISRLPLSRLEIEFDHFLDISLGACVWLSTLTHLDLTFWEHVSDPTMLSCLRRLPRLTHVTLTNLPAAASHLLGQAVCTNCPALQIVRLDIDEATVDDEDPRIVGQRRRRAYLGESHPIIKDWVRNLP
ncbi:hypothetical protein C8J57DRAFT_1275396 [Mycena rebaudengoi]|nr:hypothetical protein C8J57DRAFT_1275396 [Mycena rebaudengoi]